MRFIVRILVLLVIAGALGAGFNAVRPGARGLVWKPDLTTDLMKAPPEEAAKVSQVPGSLEAVLDALEEDHEFLLKGNVFTSDLIETWIDQKRTMEVDPMRLRPHPYEFQLYYDV